MSGMTLGLERNEETNDPKIPRLIDITDGPEVEIGVVELKIAKKEGGEINSKSFVNVCMGDYVVDVKKRSGDERDYADMDMEEQNVDKRVDKVKAKELAINEQEYIEKEL